MFLAGIAVFTLSSAVCGFAPDTVVLIVARFVQGAGAAATMPQIMSVIQLALGFSPLVTHSLRHVPVREAADASGLFTTTLQLGQAVGVATFGSVFLALAAHPVAHASAHALATTLYWLALLLTLGVVAAIPLARTTRPT